MQAAKRPAHPFWHEHEFQCGVRFEKLFKFLRDCFQVFDLGAGNQSEGGREFEGNFPDSLGKLGRVAWPKGRSSETSAPKLPEKPPSVSLPPFACLSQVFGIPRNRN